jgi:hypothetical protein
MMEAIAGDNQTPSPGGYDEEDENDSVYSRESASLETQDEAPDSAYNIRIKSHRFLRDLESEDDTFFALGNMGTAAGDDADQGDMKEIEQEDPLLSRVNVKKVSSRVTNDAKRKDEMATRRKRLQERIENKGKEAHPPKGEAIEGAVEDANIGLTAKLKEQRKYAER